MDQGVKDRLRKRAAQKKAKDVKLRVDKYMETTGGPIININKEDYSNKTHDVFDIILKEILEKTSEDVSKLSDNELHKEMSYLFDMNKGTFSEEDKEKSMYMYMNESNKRVQKFIPLSTEESLKELSDKDFQARIDMLFAFPPELATKEVEEKSTLYMKEFEKRKEHLDMKGSVINSYMKYQTEKERKELEKKTYNPTLTSFLKEETETYASKIYGILLRLKEEEWSTDKSKSRFSEYQSGIHDMNINEFEVYISKVEYTFILYLIKNINKEVKKLFENTGVKITTFETQEIPKSWGKLENDKYNSLVEMMKILGKERISRDSSEIKKSKPIVEKYTKILVESALKSGNGLTKIFSSITDMDLYYILRYSDFTFNNRNKNQIYSLIYNELGKTHRNRLVKDLIKRGWSMKQINEFIGTPQSDNFNNNLDSTATTV
tara:strand:- start:3526 stop:4830 length:1305 start_codon:yes stop_codon:yes gene_type:complete